MGDSIEMTDPHQIAHAIEAARAALKDDPRGDLGLPLRKAIWAALGARELVGVRATRGPGHRKRTQLAAVTVMHVLPLWKAVAADDDEVLQLLATAADYIEGRVTFEEAWKRKNRAWANMEKRTGTPSGQSTAIAVGFAAVCAVNTALNDENFDSASLDNPEADADLDPYEWDASFYASLAYAGGASWEAANNSQKRREFWTWYLDEAVPAVL